jgi:hypothetical protein
MLDSIKAQTLIKETMPVVCSENGQFAVVDHMEGTDAIKLTKDTTGQHHYIPLAWVTSVDDKVHIDRTGDQAMKDWSTSPVAATTPAAVTSDAVAGEAQRHVNSVDATMGQPMVARVMTRKHELEAVLSRLPADQLRARGDIELALSTINELLTGDLAKVPPVVVADMSHWLEHNKHLAESAVEVVADLVTAPVNAEPAIMGPTLVRD